MKVLVIDDEEGIREVLRDFLGVMGHEAHVASNGADGIRRFASERFDLVLTDLVMRPGISGIEVVEAVRRRDATVPIVVISGSADPLDEREIRGAGVLCLPKPIAFNEFRQAVEAQALTAR